MKDFDTFGVMIDMSRNAVMSVDALKRFLPLLKRMGYNCVMLYTEDTYEVNDEPYFGYMRGRYSKAEMKELDAFATSLGITMIPCIQTLAHMKAFFRWYKVGVDCDDILLTDDERTYELIEHMFATLAECFATRKIHVGMDEAMMLGRGKHLDKFGYETANSIIKRHLAKVCEIAKKYGYEDVLMWSDMYFRSWNEGSYCLPKREIPKEIVEGIPKEVIPVYWCYYRPSEGMFENHKQIADEYWYAGGSWGWRGMIPFNQFTIEDMRQAVDSCKKHKVRNFLMTMWGDDGAECSHFSQLPSLFYLAEYAKGNTDEKKIKAKFKSLCGIEFDEFMQIDSPNQVIPYTGRPCNPSKYMLYSDYFNDFLDYTIKQGAGDVYEEYSAQLHAIAKKSRRYGYVFDAAAKLCDVLAIKYDLGLRTRRAYEAGDRATLKSLAENEYPQVKKRLEVFLKAFEKQWMTDNKPHGFDIQHMRIGGLLCRTDACRRRILDYVNGKIERIEELDEPLLPYGNPESSLCLNCTVVNATVNVV